MEILKYLTILIILLFGGCGIHDIPSPQKRIDTLLLNIKRKGYDYSVVPTEKFDLFIVTKKTKNCRTAHIYIEGDGLAWITSRKISHNPTPLHPIGYRLFDRDEDCSIYVARPCQYISFRNCRSKYWTSHRFAKEVVESYLQALDKIKKKFKIHKFVLIGYSGGGAIAALIAAQRKDVKCLVTVAGNLDPTKWVRLHFISALSGSLNPVDYASRLQSIPQIHFIGTDDRIVPIDIAKSYLSFFQDRSRINLIEIPNTTHTKGWIELWPDLLKTARNRCK